MNSFSSFVHFSMYGGSCTRILNVLAIGFLLLCLPAGLRAQALSGIAGTVTDESGGTVSEAQVTVTNTATGELSHATTSSFGTYTITDLNPGSYTVKIEKPGFEASIVTGVNVEGGGKQASADAILKTGSSSQSIEIAAQAITLETSQPELGTVVESKLVEELPIIMGSNSGAGGRGRQIDNFLFLTPGAQGGNFEHRINGGVSFQNEVVFNGVDANQSETQGFQSNINPPYELISEFRVLRNVFSAQYGLAQGVAYYQFASGTNTLHGDVFEIMRNDYFDAPGLTPNVAGRPNVDKEHNFGFSLGGPVYVPKVYHGKDKTFFHVSSEWYRLNAGVGGTLSVPTAAMKNGDFSGLFRVDNTGAQFPIPIYVPGVISATCQAALGPIGPGQQFPGNIIPQGCISASAKALLPLIPDPDIAPNPNNPTSVFFGNKRSQLTNLPTRQTSWGFSIDHDLTSRQKIHGSFWRDTYNTPAEDNGSPFSNALSDLKNEPRIGTGLFLTYSNVFSPNLVMTAGLGWMGEINNELNAHLGQVPNGFAAAQGATILPTISFGGPYNPSTWGVNGNGETFSINRKLGVSLNNNWLWTHGRHTVNIGLEVRRSYQDDHECQRCGGNFFFSRRTTSDGTNINTTGNGFASFLLGEPNSASRQFALETKLRNLYFAPYIQDNIKITPKLTIDVGLRWDIMHPYTVDAVKGQPPNTIVFFNSSIPNPGAVSTVTGQALLGAASLLGTCPGCAGYSHADIRWRNFSPRLGFAYKLTTRTVILGGFALNHLDTGAYEYGNNKVAVNNGSLLAGIFNVNGNAGNIAGYCDPAHGGNGPSSDCTWDTSPLAVPAAGPFTPTLGIGTGVLRQFSRNPGPIAYSEQWNIGIQREIGWNTLLTASYVGNRAVHVPSMMNPINQLDPKFLSQFCPDTSGSAGPGCPLEAPWNSPLGQAALQTAGFGKDPNGLFSPYANFGTDYPSGTVFQALLPYPMYNASASAGGLFNPFDMNGSAAYNALQVEGEKRFTNGVSFLVNYTLSHAMSNTDSGFSSFNFGSLNRFNQKSEWTVASFDQTHVVNIATVYELPLGPGKKFLNHGGVLKKNLLGGWQFSGVFHYASGVPLSITSGNDPLGNGFDRANLVPGQSFNVNWNNYYKGLPVFNVNAFSDPRFAVGNSPRNISGLRSPNILNEDVGLAKKFFFGERVSAELKMDFFNVFNRVLICGPDTNVSDSIAAGGSGNFGIVGSPCQANGPRRGQAYFKIKF
jgi:hypothetical protein